MPHCSQLFWSRIFHCFPTPQTTLSVGGFLGTKPRDFRDLSLTLEQAETHCGSLNVCFSRPVPRPLTPDFHLTFPWFCLTFLLTSLLDEFLELLDASQWKYSPCLTQFYECLLLFFLNLASIIHYCLSSICLHSVAFLFFWFKRTSLDYLLCYLSHCSLEGGTITKLLIEERKHLIGRG